MRIINKIIFGFALICPMFTSAQLAVTVSPPKVTGQKAVVQLTMKNEMTNDVKAARAICILSDKNSKMVGQSTKWVIGQNKKILEPKGQTKFNFVITAPHPILATNLTAKVIFSRLILQGGKQVNAQRDVTVTPAAK